MTNRLIYLFILSCVAFAIVYFLFVNSSPLNSFHNSFKRKIRSDVFVESTSCFIDKTSWKFLGFFEDRYFLSNVGEPNIIQSIDRKTLEKKNIRLQIGNVGINDFRLLSVTVDSNYFRCFDRATSTVFLVSTNNYRVKDSISLNFNQVQSVFPSTYSLISTTLDHDEGIILEKVSGCDPIKIDKKILKTQVDGLFCKDGILVYNSDIQKVIYVYSYRNQIAVIDTNLNLNYYAKTIDTVSSAKVVVKTKTITGEKKLASPAFVINKKVATAGKYLFVHSALRADNEDKSQFSNSWVIDAYNLAETGKYEFSFYIRREGNKKLEEMYVSKNELITISNDSIYAHLLKRSLFP